MSTVTIHDSGKGGERVRVESIGNGLAYAAYFGEAGSPVCNLYFQGEDASQIRDEIEALEHANPERLTRDIWLSVLDQYLY